MKKILKIVGIVLLLLVVLILLAPIIFKGPIEKAVKNSINNSVTATVDWEDMDLSLYSNFPDAQITLKNLRVINKAPFEGDTLATSGEIGLSMDIPQLFKGSPYSINELIVDNAYINIKVDSLGNANYDIAKETTPTNDQAASSGQPLSLDIQHYEINNSRINYLDESSKTFMRLTEVNHEGNGDFTADKTTLSTNTDALVSFELDSVNYLNKNRVKLQADFEMDLENQKYTFLENEALINQLPLTFDGFIKVNENNNEIDLTFKTPSSDFKNFLAVIPETYSKNLDNVETSGDFTVNGRLNGVIDDEKIPMMDISINSNNASFKYPDLPKRVDNITIDAQLKNETGLLKDTYVNLNNLNFRIDQDVFNAKGNFKNVTENMLVDLMVKGTLNLANLDQAYPMDLDMDLNGILNADFTTNFDMNSIENERYQNVKSNGTASITNFKYKSPEIPNEVSISKARLSFNTSKVTLQEMQATAGQTDASISGSLDNFMGYLFSDQELKGRFNVKSNTFSINDFMVAETKETTTGKGTPEEKTTSVTTGEESVKIPSFLDARLDFTANKVLYDNLVLNNAKGALIIKDETATLENVSTDAFGGGIKLNGDVSTKNETPTFNMKLNLNQLSIVQSFQQLELLQNIAPITKALEGTLNTDLTLSGNLNKSLSPILSSLGGNAMAEIMNAQVSTSETPLLSKLNSKMNFLNLDKLNLRDLTTNLTFNNGQVEVQPFDFKIKDINITAGGSHSFSNEMNYNLKLDIPAKYLGSEVGGALAQLNQSELETMKVDLPIGLSGSFSNPNIQINIKQAVTNLAQQIAEKQKDKVKDQLKDKVKDFLGGNNNNNNNDQNNTSSEGNNTATKDSTATQEEPKSQEEQIKEAAGNVINGLFGKKEKKDDKK